MHAILRAIVSIKCDHPLKFEEIVVRNVAQKESDSTSAILSAFNCLHTPPPPPGPPSSSKKNFSCNDMQDEMLCNTEERVNNFYIF